MLLPERRESPSGDGIISAIVSFCITQCAISCSTYCSVLPLKTSRSGSAWKKQAEMPIFSMQSDRLGEDPFEVRARARAGIGLVADVVDRHLDQRRDIRRRDRALRLIRSEEHTSELQSHHDLVCRLLL